MAAPRWPAALDRLRCVLFVVGRGSWLSGSDEFGLEDFGYGSPPGQTSWQGGEACDDKHGAWYEGDQRPQWRVGHGCAVVHGGDQHDAGGNAEERAGQRWKGLRCGYFGGYLLGGGGRGAGPRPRTPP